MTPRLVFFDIDDTLYDKHAGCVPNSTVQALTKLAEQGIMLAIATGRAKAVFPKSVNALIDKLGIDSFVTINGQYVEHQGTCLAHFPLSAEQIADTCTYLAHQKMAYALMGADRLSCVGDSPWIRQALSSLDMTQDERPLAAQAPIYQILAFCEDNQAFDIQLLDSLKTVRWHKHGLDILDKGGTKLRGILALLGHLGIDPKHCMAFGDGHNDLEMITAVGCGVAMGNACQDLQAVADFVAPSIDDDGIWRALVDLGVIV